MQLFLLQFALLCIRNADNSKSVDYVLQPVRPEFFSLIFKIKVFYFSIGVFFKLQFERQFE
jgi:hypothetical protein